MEEVKVTYDVEEPNPQKQRGTQLQSDIAHSLALNTAVDIINVLQD